MSSTPSTGVRAMEVLAPELEAELPRETLADCGACPMTGRPFLSDVRCRTFHPVLATFLTGRALERGWVGAARILARLEDADGLDLLGIGPPAGWKETYERDREEAFGRRRSWACPFWVEGSLACSVGADRDSTCRSWFCRHVDGAHGQRGWAAWRKLGRGAESALARAAADVVGTETADGAEAWAAHYRACWHWVDGLDEEAVGALCAEHLSALADDLTAVERASSMPAHPVPNVRSVTPEGDDVVLVGYSDWQPGRFPKRIFGVLGQLDGILSWEEAVERARAEGVDVDEDWGRQLLHLDPLREVDP